MKSYYIVDNAGADLDEAIIDLNGYWKTQSILYLKKLGLPVLDGIIITRWNDEVHNAVINFCKQNGWDALLLRHDKKPEYPPYPRGGYLVSLDNIQKEALKFFALGRILILLEPCSPFDNSYNVNILFEDENSIVLEVVGPGFDASDLQRGDITPHEIIHINREMLKKGYGIPECITKRSILVDRKSYEASVKNRYLKIARRLMDLNEITISKEAQEDELISIAKQYLKNKNYNMLLLNEKEYKPIPENYLYEICHYIYNLPERLQQYIDQDFPFVVSASYVKKGEKLNFWDIVWPKLKYKI